MWGFLPHVDQKPRRLVLQGRGENPADHGKASYRVEAFDISTYKKPDELPVAAMPLKAGEEFFVYRAKMRPLLVLQPKMAEVSGELRRKGSPSHTVPTVLVAPYYGADTDGTRGGWDAALVERIRRLEYSQYMWDRLPMSKNKNESILRFDHVTPIGRERPTYTLTNYRLTQIGLGILDEWLNWVFTGKLAPEGALHYLRGEFLGLPSSPT